MKTKKIAFLGLFIALAMILSYIELQIPTFIPVPGIKLGLPNIVIIIVLYRFGWKEAVTISIIRVLLVSALFGTALSLLYSISGATVSLLVMIILKKINKFSSVMVSVSGGIFHNIGQIGIAAFVMKTVELLYYLPILLIGGTVSGIIIGLLGAQVVKNLDKIEI